MKTKPKVYLCITWWSYADCEVRLAQRRLAVHVGSSLALVIASDITSQAPQATFMLAGTVHYHACAMPHKVPSWQALLPMPKVR